MRLTAIPSRYLAWLLCALGALLSLGLTALSALWWLLALPLLALTLLGLWDVVQRTRTVSRNYPVVAHFRYLLESIGPELRQYFIQSDTDELPFSREQRSVVYQRAKNVLDKKPFGSLVHMNEDGYEWLNHSLAPVHIADSNFRVRVGSHPKTTQPYDVSVFNISAMSFGSLSANAILALNTGAKKGGFYHDTGEGSISRYHLRPGGDLVWEIGSGYFGCRTPDGSFDAELFERNARLPQVKMIEIKLSQGAKPGHGGILPGAKVSAEIAEARGVPVGEDVVSPASHSAFSTPLELMDFIGQLRALSGGKPVGFKLAIGHPWEWFGIVKAMIETGEHPDFIVVDGGEGGTGAAPLEFINRLGTPMTDGLLMVHNTLVGANLREKIQIGAAGKITSAFNIARTLAIGADWCNAARGYMFSLGCIQSLSCHSGKCPSGVATQDPSRSARLDVADKSERVYHFHRNTVLALAHMLEAAGLNHPSELGPEHLIRRVSRSEVRPYSELFEFLEPGVLLDGRAEIHLFKKYWAQARADSFAPPDYMLKLRETKVR